MEPNGYPSPNDIWAWVTGAFSFVAAIILGLISYLYKSAMGRLSRIENAQEEVRQEAATAREVSVFTQETMKLHLDFLARQDADSKEDKKEMLDAIRDLQSSLHKFEKQHTSQYATIEEKLRQLEQRVPNI